MKTEWDLFMVESYALGYYHGRAYGQEDAPVDDDTLRWAYRLGYDSGVADYCRDIDDGDQ